MGTREFVHTLKKYGLGCGNFSKDCPWLNKIRENFLQNDRDDDLKMMFERNVRWIACPVRSAWFAKSKSEGYQERIVFFFLPLLLLPLSPPPYLLLRPQRPPPPPAIPSAAGNPSRVRGLRRRKNLDPLRTTRSRFAERNSSNRPLPAELSLSLLVGFSRNSLPPSSPSIRSRGLTAADSGGRSVGSTVARPP